jgi:hypothetical protein
MLWVTRFVDINLYTWVGPEVMPRFLAVLIAFRSSSQKLVASMAMAEAPVMATFRHPVFAGQTPLLALPIMPPELVVALIRPLLG